MLEDFLSNRPGHHGALGIAPFVDMPASDVPMFFRVVAERFGKDMVEQNVIYIGTQDSRFDLARAGKQIGVVRSGQDLLDDYVRQESVTHTSLAYNSATDEIGILLQPSVQSSEVGISRVPSALFVSKERHLACAAAFAAMLTPQHQRELTQGLSIVCTEATNDQLKTYLLSHPSRRSLSVNDTENVEKEKITFLPRSMDPNIFSTEGSIHLTRAFLEPTLHVNKFKEGRFIGDAHNHRALTAERISQNPRWYAALLSRFENDPVETANMLSLSDVRRYMQMGNVGRSLGLSALNFAFREIYVVDDTAKVVAHSVFNFIELNKNKDVFQTFIRVAKEASASTDPEVHLAFYDLVKQHTDSLPVGESISERHYHRKPGDG